MGHRVCPWWIGYFLLSPLRRWRQNPQTILAPYVRDGMTVLEPGPAMGFFTLEIARLAGPAGQVIAVDIQEKMLAQLRRRAAKRGLSGRIETRVARPDSLALDDLKGRCDFALAFAIVHELPAAAPFFRETAAAMKPGALLLLAEPRGHVQAPEFEAELQAASAAGFMLVERPSIGGSHAALLQNRPLK